MLSLRRLSQQQVSSVTKSATASFIYTTTGMCIPRTIPTEFRRWLATPSAAAISKNEDSILINWNKEKNSWSKFHFDWLRDNCPCTKCEHPKYHQRLINGLEDATPANVDVEGSEAVEVEWRDGHHSQYSYNWLLTNSYCHNNVTKATKKREITLWDRNSMVDPPEVNYNNVMTDDKELLAFLKNTYQYGFCFVLNTPPTRESMFEIGSRVGPYFSMVTMGNNGTWRLET